MDKLIKYFARALVGANVNGKPNYTPVAHTGLWITRSSVALTGNSHSNKGIKENGTFSFNIPSQEQLILTDYCGLVSGKDTDKGALFTNFYGELGTAPMIEECPLNMEFRVVETTVSPRARPVSSMHILALKTLIKIHKKVIIYKKDFKGYRYLLKEGSALAR